MIYILMIFSILLKIFIYINQKRFSILLHICFHKRYEVSMERTTLKQKVVFEKKDFVSFPNVVFPSILKHYR